MQFLFGAETYSVDTKGRVKIPSRVRQFLTEEDDLFYATQSPHENCIFLYPKKEFEAVVERMKNYSVLAGGDDIAVRMFVGISTEPCKLLAQSRIMLSESMRRFINITNEVVIIGVGNLLALWEPKTFDEFKKRTEARSQELYSKAFGRSGN
ncbi:MAG: hypothetical protein KGZ58_11105 [Ignavibacteriales bacterium]|nr:hypothetical protein [Ignavibacteriales bacterium]